jgi:hypothetical protein
MHSRSVTSCACNSGACHHHAGSSHHRQRITRAHSDSCPSPRAAAVARSSHHHHRAAPHACCCEVRKLFTLQLDTNKQVMVSFETESRFNVLMFCFMKRFGPLSAKGHVDAARTKISSETEPTTVVVSKCRSRGLTPPSQAAILSIFVRTPN